MTSKKERGSDDGRKEPGFEKALERLEKIVSEMESGKLALDEMIGRFEEGQTLIKICTQKLNEVERKIEVLVKKGDATEAVAFEPEPEESPGEDDAAPESRKEDGVLF